MRWFAAPLLLLFQTAFLDIKGVDNYPLHSTSDTALMTLDIFRRQHLWQLTAFVCNKLDGIQLLRLTGETVQTAVIYSNIDSESKFKSARGRLGIIVFPGNNCAGKSDTRSLPSPGEIIRKYRNSTYRWLLFSNSMENTFSDLEHTRIEWDTSLTAVVPDKNFSVGLNLFDVYRKDDNILSAHPVGQWQNRSMKKWLDAENAPHRKNMHKERILFGITVTRHKSWDNSKMMKILDSPPDDPKIPDENTQMMPYHVLRITSEMFNYTLAGVNGYKSPGYPQPNGTYTDLIGAIHRGEVLLSATNLLVLNHRRKFVKYLGFCTGFRNILVYLSTNSFSTPTALFKPFSSGLWILFGLYLLLSSALMMSFFLCEKRIKQGPQEISFSKSSLIVLGSISGQGEPTNLSSTSFSSLLLTLLVFGFLLQAAYSAVIVQFLLAEPSPTYLTFNDLMESSLKVAAFDFYYYRNSVFGPNKSEVYSKIYEKKMIPPGGFKDMHSAIGGLLKGKWAYLVPDIGLYQLIKSATPQQKCRLFEIPDTSNLQNPLCPMIHKDSPRINMFNRGLTLLRERGFYSRFLRIWCARKQKCEEGGARQWNAVAFKVLYPAFGLISGGFLTSLLLLFLETVYFRWESNYRWKFRSTNNRNLNRTKNKDANIIPVA